MAPRGGGGNGGAFGAANDDEMVQQISQAVAAAVTSQLKRSQSRGGGSGGGAGGRGNAPLRGGTSHNHGGAASHGGQAAGSGATNGGGALDRSKASMWTCGSCGATTTYGFKSACHMCKTPRHQRATPQGGGGPPSRSTSSGGTQRLSPSGAWTSEQPRNTTRGTSSSPSPPSHAPLSAPTAPTLRPNATTLGVAASSVPAPRPQVVGNGSVVGPQGANGYGPMLQRGGSSSGGGGTAKQANTDADGFTKVLPTRWRKGQDDKSWLKSDEQFPPPQTAAGTANQPRAAPAPSSGADNVPIIVIDDAAEEQVEPPTLDQLRETLDAKQRVVRILESSGDVSEHCPAIIAARLDRDQAKAALDAAKPAKPGFHRHRQAEQALNKATKVRDGTRASMRQLEADFKARMAAFEAQLDADEDNLAAAQADFDNVLRALPRTSGEVAKAQRCQGMLRTLGTNGPRLQSVAEAIQNIAPEYAAELRSVVAALDMEYRETTAVVQQHADFYRLDEASSEPTEEEDDLDRELRTHDPGYVPPTPITPANGQGTASLAAAAAATAPPLPPRARPEGSDQPPGSKKHCDGATPMDEDDTADQLTVQQCYDLAQAAGVKVEAELELFSPLQLQSWALSNGIKAPR